MYCVLQGFDAPDFNASSESSSTDSSGEVCGC